MIASRFIFIFKLLSVAEIEVEALLESASRELLISLPNTNMTLLGTCTYSNYNNSYSKYYEYKGNVISRIT